MENQPTSIKSKKRNIPTRRKKNLFSSTEFRETTNHWRSFFLVFISFHLIWCIGPKLREKIETKWKDWKKKKEIPIFNTSYFFPKHELERRMSFLFIWGFFNPRGLLSISRPGILKMWGYHFKSKVWICNHRLFSSSGHDALLVKLDMDLCLLLRLSMTSLNRLIVLKLK